MFDAGDLSRTELARLEELLEDDASLEYYLSVAQQDAALRTVAKEMDLPVARMPQKSIASKLLGQWRFAAAAAIFLAGYLSSTALPDLFKKSSAGPVAAKVEAPPPARITGMMGVRWKNGVPPDLIGTAGEAHELDIESGLVEVTYASGVRVTLEGPASFGITGHASATLTNGKLVTSVPKGAEGFRIDYQDGEVIDLGTEFAMEVKAGKSSEVGVFDGEIELRRNGEEPLSLFENHAVYQDVVNVGSSLQSIPLDRSKYVRQLPSREFAWEVSSAAPQELVFDVSHLLWRPSQYRAVFRWINGRDGIVVRNVELRRDDRIVSSDPHLGMTGGGFHLVRDNIFELGVNADQFHSGHWTLHATLESLPRDTSNASDSAPVRSLGVLQFEEGLVTSATAADFIGRWSYRYLGNHFIREFHSDHTIRLYRDGKYLAHEFVGSRWEVVKGRLRVTIPDRNAYEDHILRDRDTLIFINQHYENASRLDLSESVSIR